jgi:hypothetical protein
LIAFWSKDSKLAGKFVGKLVGKSAGKLAGKSACKQARRSYASIFKLINRPKGVDS